MTRYNIPGLSGYQADAVGNIWSLLQRCYSKNRRGVRYRIGKKAKKLKSRISAGYLALAIRGNTHLVHRLVLLAFRGVPKPGHDVARHLDGNKTNNRINNLAWGTYEENEADKTVHGTRLRGTQLYNSKLTASKVRDARIRFKNGESQNSIARSLGVNGGTICNAIRGITWKHIK